MSLRIYFSDYCENKILESQHARISTKEEALHSMDCVLHRAGNFLGLIDAQGATLQFLVNKDGTILVDVPVPAERGSYVKTTDLEMCFEIVRSLGDSVKREEIAGLTFQSW